MKGLVGASNKVKALVGAFSGHCETSRRSKVRCQLYWRRRYLVVVLLCGCCGGVMRVKTHKSCFVGSWCRHPPAPTSSLLSPSASLALSQQAVFFSGNSFHVPRIRPTRPFRSKKNKTPMVFCGGKLGHQIRFMFVLCQA